VRRSAAFVHQAYVSMLHEGFMGVFKCCLPVELPIGFVVVLIP